MARFAPHASTQLWRRLYDRWQSRISEPQEPHLREDLGLPPLPAPAPRISPLVLAWAR
jgi:hypothetical protein